MTTIPFLKMHGLGNDFAILDVRSTPVVVTHALARAIADRRRGVGCDQVITIEPPHQDGATATMGIRNSDGSLAETCGNAARCVAHFLMYESGLKTCVIETSCAILSCHRQAESQGQRREMITVDMGPARFAWQQIPLAEARDTLHVGLTQGALSDPVVVSMGNPHAVFFVDDVMTVPLHDDGPKVETHPLFPHRTNVEAAQVLGRDRLRVRVWERGVGITESCGSGACAVMAASFARGFTEKHAEVVLDGGSLFMEWCPDSGHVLMTGPVATTYRGVLDREWVAMAVRP